MRKKQLDYARSDDYAVLTSGRYEFYYGYESAVADVWHFTVKENGKEVFSMSDDEINEVYPDSLGFDCADMLLAGIGVWLLNN